MAADPRATGKTWIMNRIASSIDNTRELELFSRLVVHEARGPLTVIRKELDRIRDGENPGKLDPLEALFLDKAIERSQTVLDVASRVLVYARLGSFDRPMRQVRLNNVVEKSIGRAQDRFGEEVLDVDISALPKVVGHAGLLEDLFFELLCNAVSYRTGEKATICIDTVNSAAGHGEIAFSDDGVGIPLPDQDHVFDLLYRAPAHVNIPGSGVGLSIVRRIMACHEGYARLTSAPGMGTTVHLEFHGGN